MIVTFCGHRDVPDQENVKKWLTHLLEKLIAEGATEFYLGGYGQFDHLAAAVLQELKRSHPDIRIILALAYLNQRYNRQYYDETVYPELEHVPYNVAIPRRNEWMVQKADVVIAYVIFSWGGAAETLACAKRKKKIIYEYDTSSVRERLRSLSQL